MPERARRERWARGLRRLGAGLATALTLGLAPAQLPPDGAASVIAPRVAVDQIAARSPDGRMLGTLVLPAFVDPGKAHDAGRPLLIVFNGGPGAATGWLQLGLLGPLRAAVPDDPAAPIGSRLTLEPNREGLWGRADMLFVDPLDTGFSRSAPGVSRAAIRDWRADGDYIARAVREWMARHGRSGAPLYLLGESYGAERAVAVADALTRGGGPVRIAGLALLSQTITTEASLKGADPVLASAVGLPTMAATACYFGTSSAGRSDPARCAARMQAFAMDAYVPELRAGEGLSRQRREALRQALAGLTGLPAAALPQGSPAIATADYRRLAFSRNAIGLGQYDSRYAAPFAPGRRWEDPSLDPLLAPMQDAAERNARAMFRLDRSPIDGSPYVLFNADVHATWTYGGRPDPYASIDMADILGKVLARNGAKLLVAGGMFDSVGSYGGDRYLASQLGRPEGSVWVSSYPAGHMFYLDDASRRSFVALLKQFVGV